jgi:predicted urease superfamily metal-dependent hydrolase
MKPWSMEWFVASLSLWALTMLASAGPLTPKPYEGPIIDAHVHLSAASDPEQIRSLFQSNGVTHAVFFPRQFRAGDDRGVSPDQEKQLSKRYQFIGTVLIGLQRDALKRRGNDRLPYWLNPDDQWSAFIQLANAQLQSGERHGMGELIIRHYDYHGKGHGENDFPIESKVVSDLMRLSHDWETPLVFHAESEPHVVDALMRRLPQFPKGRFVWAHACGRSSAQRVRQWLNANPNLYCDLANMTDTGHYGSLWPKASDWTAQVERNGTWVHEWQLLIEDYPDRFMIGSDVNEVKGWRGAWGKRMDRFRILLGQLKPSTAAALAHLNAKRLFRLP